MIQIPPSYKVTPKMLEYISKIEANLLFLASLNLQEIQKERIKRVSILKSSLFSARIEGNSLTYEKVQEEDENDEKKEIFNIYKAVEFLEKRKPSGITLKEVSDLHAKVLEGLSPDCGCFRSEPSAIFNQAGEAVYITPAPDKIPSLLKQMLKFSNSNDEKFPLINAFISHLVFEKIHPFIDGNGRVGRLLIFAVLKKNQKYPFFVPFEEYLDEHRDGYYNHLDKGLKNTEEYLLFMLEAFYGQTEKLKKDLEAETKEGTPLLTPRQEEILNIIKDQMIVSFDQIQRRFMQVPKRTLSFDLKKLIDQGLVIKIGKTKGSFYQLKQR